MMYSCICLTLFILAATSLLIATSQGMECSLPSVGRECRLTCHCRDQKYCRPNGTCGTYGCQTNYDGDTCQRKNTANTVFSEILRNPNRDIKDFVNEVYSDNSLTIDATNSIYKFADFRLDSKVTTTWMAFFMMSDCRSKATRNDRLKCVREKNVEIFASEKTSTQRSSDGVSGNTLCRILNVKHHNRLNGERDIFEVEVECVANAPYEYVRIQLRDKNTANIELFQLKYYKCEEFTFNRRCAAECNCKEEDEKCNSVTGACRKSGCSVGYTGESCLETCSDKTFGDRCARSCYCKDPTEQCHYMTGACRSGCSGRRVGRSCQIECPEAKFSVRQSDPTCTGDCRCIDNANCRPQGGRCMDDKCPVKRQDPTGGCQICVGGYFGIECIPCHCIRDEPCSDGGKCENGCAPGWKGDLDCQQVNGTPTSPTTPTQSTVVTPGSTGLNLPLVIGAGVAVPVCVIAFVVICYVVYRRSRTGLDFHVRNEPNYDNCACVFWYTDKCCGGGGAEPATTASRRPKFASRPRSKADIQVNRSRSGRSMTVVKDPSNTLEPGQSVELAYRYVPGLDAKRPSKRSNIRDDSYLNTASDSSDDDLTE